MYVWGGAAVVFLLLAVFFLARAADFPENIEIVHPGPSDEVGSRLAVEGIWGHLRRSSRIGVAVYAYATGEYQFHYDHTIVNDDGTWCSSHVIVGDETSGEGDYKVLALLMTDAARLRLRDYLRNPLRKPLTELPKDMRVLCEVDVRRRARGQPLDRQATDSASCKKRATSEASSHWTLRWLYILAAIANILAFVMSLFQARAERLRQEAPGEASGRVLTAGPADSATILPGDSQPVRHRRKPRRGRH